MVLSFRKWLRLVLTILCIALLGWSIASYLGRPTRQAALGPVSLIIQRCETNTEGNVTALVSISNGGPYVLRFGFRTEMKHASRWVDPPGGRSLDFAADPLLPSAIQRSFSVPLSQRGI